MMIGVKTAKFAVAEYAPVLAPSSACARQKYERPVASRSGRRSVVRPPSPGGIASREKTLLVNPVSVATSNTHDRGRTPLLEAFSIRSETGWSSTAIFEPTAGSRAFGAVISTPGIGPATVGLSGFSLFEASHAVTASIAAHTPMAHKTLRIIADSPGVGIVVHTNPWPLMRILSIGYRTPEV